MATIFDRLFGWFGYTPTVAAAPPPALIQFTWEAAVGYGPDNKPRPLNERYFATEDTAKRVMTLNGAFEVVNHDCPGNGGPYTSVPSFERWLRWLDGTQANAGLVADAYERGIRNTRDHNVGIQTMESYVKQARADYRGMKERGEIPWEQ